MLILSTPHICQNHHNHWLCKNNDRYEVWCWNRFWCWCMKLPVTVSVWCVSVRIELEVETQVPVGKGELTGNKVKTGYKYMWRKRFNTYKHNHCQRRYRPGQALTDLTKSTNKCNKLWQVRVRTLTNQCNMLRNSCNNLVSTWF